MSANACVDLLGRGRPLRKTSVTLAAGQRREAHCKFGARTAALSPPRICHDLISGGELTIDPTTIAVKANKESPDTVCDVISSLDYAGRRKSRPFGYGRSKARSAAVPTEPQPYRNTASGTDSHSPGAFPISRHAPGISLRCCRGVSYIDGRCGLIGLSEAFCSRGIGRLLLRRRFGN